MFKIFRKLLKALRGGHNRREVFLGVFLGFGLGLVPGFNLTAILFLLPLLFLNVNGAAGAMAIIAGKVLMIVAAAALYYTGFALVNYLGAAPLINQLAETPVLAMLDWHIYAVLGAFVLAIIFGGILAAWVSAVIYKLNRVMAAAGGAESASGVGKFGRFMLRTIVGRDAIDADAKSPLFKKSRCIAAIAVMVLIGVFCAFFLDSVAASSARRVIGRINGAEVNIEDIDISPAGGSVIVRGLQVTDAEKPARNRFAAGEIAVDISMAELLKRRVVISDIRCNQVRLDNKRSQPGEVYADQQAAGDTAAEEEETPSLLESVTSTVGDGAAKSVEYLKQIKKVNEKLAQLRDYLTRRAERRRQQRQQSPEEFREAELRAKGYLKAEAAELVRKKPTWTIVHVIADDVVVTPVLPTFIIEGSDISSNPELHGKKMSISARPDPKILKDLQNIAGAAVKQTTDAVKQVADGAANTASKAISDVVSGKPVKSLEDAGKNIGKNAENAAKDVADGVENTFKSLFKKDKD